MTISTLATYTNITPKSNQRIYPITRITPHHMSGVHSGKWCADYFCETARQCSVNYAIGVDGDIACNVPEERRAWTSASGDNDQRAITFELSDGDYSYNYMSDATINAFIDLCVDLFRRYPSLGGKMVYTGDETGNVTLHRWYQDTDCPSQWLIEKLPEICYRVNKKLGVKMECYITVAKKTVVYFDGEKLRPFGTATEMTAFQKVAKGSNANLPNVQLTQKEYSAFVDFLAR